MAIESGQSNSKRYDIPYFEGLNSLVNFHIANKSEFSYGENFRSIDIGTIEKRAGQTVIGTAVGGATFSTNNNYGLFFFDVDVATNQGLYRLSEGSTSGKANIYYLNELGTVSSANVIAGGSSYVTTPVVPTSGGSGSGLTVSTSVSTTGSILSVGIINPGTGYKNGEYVTITGGNGDAVISVVTPNEWKVLTGKGSDILAGNSNESTDGENLFLVNYTDKNRYIKEDGVTVMDSTDASGHFYNSPKAKLVKYYKNRVYLANYKQEVGTGLSGAIINPGTGYTTAGATATTGGSGTGLTVSFVAGAGFVTSVTVVAPGTNYVDGDVITLTTGGANATFTLTTNQTKYPTTILRSSFPLGIVALLNSDNPAGLLTPAGAPTDHPEIFADGVPTVPPTYNTGSTGATKLDVTDTNYFYTATGAKDYEVYRGGTKIADIVITSGGIHETSIDVTYTFTGSITKFLASDEVWIKDTFKGKKIFRWINNSSITGRDVKQYDTFKLSGGNNSPITMMETVGNVLMVSNKNSLASWNDYTLENLDLNVGCTSEHGHVKLLGNLYFMHYRGVFMTSGGPPQLISNKIQKYITGATKAGKENSAAGRAGTSVFFTLGDVTWYNPDKSIDKIIKDVCIEYNTTSQNWFAHSNVKATEFASFVEHFNPDKLVFTTPDKNLAIKEFLNGTTDDGEEIFMRVDLNKITFQGAYENINTLNSMIIESERGNALRVFVSITEVNNEWYEIEGQVMKGISILKISPEDDEAGEPTQCRLLNVSLRDSSLQTPKLTRMSILYTPEPNPSIVQ